MDIYKWLVKTAWFVIRVSARLFIAVVKLVAPPVGRRLARGFNKKLKQGGHGQIPDGD